jgi:hypothetical protein
LNKRTIIIYVLGMQILLLTSCSRHQLCPAFTSHNRFMESFTPFSKGFITSHSTGNSGDPFRVKGITHGIMEAVLGPFQSNTRTSHGGAGRTSPFSSGKSASKKGSIDDDSFLKGKSKHKGDHNIKDSFAVKNKKREPPKDKHEDGLWPTYMRIKD